VINKEDLKELALKYLDKYQPSKRDLRIYLFKKSREIPLVLKTMKKSRFTEVQVVQALQMHESGVATGVICREMGIAPATFYKWKAKYGGLDVSDVQKLKTLEEEHSRL